MPSISGLELALLPYILQGVTLGFSAGVSPGPLQAYFLSQTLKNGWKRTLPAAFAPLISDGPIIALVLLVLTQTPDWLRRGLQIAGGAFLLYLAWEAWKNFRTPQQSTTPSQDASRSLRDATIMNLLNPNPYIFWGTILGPILVTGWRQSPRLGVGFIVGFYAALIAVFMGFIVLFGTAGKISRRLTQMLSAVSALALLIFGVYQAVAGVLG